MNNNQQQLPPIDLKTTTPILNGKKGHIFLQGVLLRKVSKFVTGTDSDGIMPIPVFYCEKTGKVLESSIPTELREEYKEHSM